MAFLNNNVKLNESENQINKGGRNSHHIHRNHVQVLLFKESRLKGRSLIFDSSVIDNLSESISDVIVASSVNIRKLTDMVFGSLTLRCHETYFRIHNLSSPNRIMFSQVFPVPDSKKIKWCALHPQPSCTEKDIKVLYLGTESYDASLKDTSLSLELGINGVQLDSQLLFDQYNVPNSSTSTIDSGYAEASSCSLIISNRSSFNSNTSLNHGLNKLPKIETHTLLTDSNIYLNDSVNDCSTKTSPTLGLVIILAITTDMEKYSKCYMKHIAFMESIVFRIRQNIELVFDKPGILLSMMIQVSNESTQWLIRLFPSLQGCSDMNNRFKLSRYLEESYDDPLKLKISSLRFKINNWKFSFLHNARFRKKYKHCQRDVPYTKKSENCFNEFCELLKQLENKETNFFISNIITSTLTYHLGWITTCFTYRSTHNDFVFQPDRNSYNSLWIQMTELYGAHGCPTKSAQTIINGCNQIEIISKVLHFIQYFVRYSRVVHNCLERININKDNKTADMICLNYKYSGNYLTESSTPKCFQTQQMKSPLTKSKAWSSNLSDLSKDEHNYQEQDLSQDGKVTFLLGEDEELINIKPISRFKNTTNQKDTSFLKINGGPLGTIQGPTLDPLMHSNHFLKHSNSSSILDRLYEPIKQSIKYLELVERNNNKRSKSEPPSSIRQQKIFDLLIKNGEDIKYTCTIDQNEKNGTPICYQMPNSNFQYFKLKNKKELCINRKPRTFKNITKMKIFCFPLPRFKLNSRFETSCASILKSDRVGNYVPDLVVQGTNIPQKDWLLKLKRDLYLTRQIYFFDGYVDESVAVVGNIDKWDVEVISSRVCINKKTIGTKLDISSLVENMLEVLLQMWNLNFSKKYNATHIEQRLLEICIRSYALSELLLQTDMCTMDLLSTTLHFEINDVPLLMSVASIIAPHVTKKYGISFQ